jgi:O-antigen biosynthesis protein
LSLPACSVVIPTYNGRRLLETCLPSVYRHLPRDMDVEVIVVDDASTDDTAKWVAFRYPQVRLIQLHTNVGFCGAANAGIAAASGPIIQLLNNDTEVMPGWIEAGVAPFSDPRVGSVAPLVLVRSDPSRVDSAGDQYALVGWPSKRGHGEPAAKWTSKQPELVFGASGSSAFYRAQAVRLAGAYDPSFGSYYEDVDLAFRLRWAGYVCMFTPHSQILHEVSASYDHSRPELQRRMSRNAEVLFWSNLPLPWLVVAVVPHLGFSLSQAVWRLARGRLRPFLAGKRDALSAASGFRVRRAQRADLARAAMSRPHFPISLALVAAARNHLRRPREARRASEP